jgi:tryptophan-rich sensory protein
MEKRTAMGKVIRPSGGLLSGLPGLVFWLVLSAVVATSGARFEPGDWYLELDKPGWTPPNWLFGPVWTLLYIAMAVAVWLVWRAGGWTANRWAVLGYLTQLALNGAWSWIFFGEQLIGLALVDIVCLLFMIIVVLALFWGRRRIAGLLMLPYAIWVGFATALNYQLWIMN